MTTFWETLQAGQQMLIVGPIIGAMCAILSVYIVLRRMALISEGVSHAGFGGIAVALLVGYFVPALDLPHLVDGKEVGSHIWWQIITGLFCLGTALLIGYVSRRKRVSEDAAIGIFLVAAVALGVLLISIRTHLPHKGPMPVDLESLLFGHFATVDVRDTWLAAATLVIVIAVVAVFYFQFLYTTLDEEMARINGVRTRFINTLQLMLISLVIVVCGRMVGFLMITALTIIPGATASMLSRRFSGVMIGSILIGTLGTFAATCLALIPPFDSYPTGPLVVLLLFAIFVVVWIFRHFVKPKAAEERGTGDDEAVAATKGFGHHH